MNTSWKFQGVSQRNTLNYTTHPTTPPALCSLCSQWVTGGEGWSPAEVHTALLYAWGICMCRFPHLWSQSFPTEGKQHCFTLLRVDVQQLCLSLFSDTGMCKGVGITCTIKGTGFVYNLTKNKKHKLNLYFGAALNGLLALFAGVGVQAVIAWHTVSIFISQCIFPATERLQAEMAVCVAAGHPAGALHVVCKRWKNCAIQCMVLDQILSSVALPVKVGQAFPSHLQCPGFLNAGLFNNKMVAFNNTYCELHHLYEQEGCFILF